MALTLTDFLLARLAEDEASAREATEYPWSIRSTPWGKTFDIVADGLDDRAGHWFCIDPARVLAEVEAKRRIVEVASAAVNLSLDDGWDKALVFGRIHDGASVLQALAQPYAEHPDFREEWRA